MTQICELPVDKSEGVVGKTIRKIIGKIAPVEARVRYDAHVGKWAVLDKDNNPIRHFTHGVMTGVTFRVATTKVSAGCGPAQDLKIGIAEGMLRENSHGTDAAGFKNFSFSNGEFVDTSRNVIEGCKVLRLMSDRGGLYK